MGIVCMVSWKDQHFRKKVEVVAQAGFRGEPGGAHWRLIQYIESPVVNREQYQDRNARAVCTKPKLKETPRNLSGAGNPSLISSFLHAPLMPFSMLFFVCGKCS